ncbi:hypothetical protein ACFLQR_03965 [Verrucomicrobiota bacterium]
MKNAEQQKIVCLGGGSSSFAGVLGLVILSLVTGAAWGATRTWDNDSANNNWSDAANWSGDTKPIAGDSVIIPDCSVMGGCILDEDTANALNSMNLDVAGASFNFTTNTVYIGAGGWDSELGSVTMGTGKIQVTANCSFRYPNAIHVYDLYIEDNVSIGTIPGRKMQVGNSVTIDGTTGGGVSSGDGFLIKGSTTADPFTIGANGSITGMTYLDFISTTISFNLPSATYPNLIIQPGAKTATFTGNIIASSLTVSSSLPGDTIIDCNDKDLTLTGSMSLGAGRGAIFKAKSGTITVGGNVTIANLATYNTYIEGDTSTWHINGDYANSSPDAGWDWGTATVIMEGGTDKTIKTSGINFSSLSIDKSSSTAKITLQDALVCDDDLTISGGILDLDGKDLTITGTLSNSATFVLQGDETVSIGTFTNSTDSTVRYDGSSGGNIITGTYYNLEITGEGTFTSQYDIVSYNLAADAGSGNTVTLANATFSAINNLFWIKSGICYTDDKISKHPTGAGTFVPLSGGANTIVCGQSPQIDVDATLEAGWVPAGTVWFIF